MNFLLKTTDCVPNFDLRKWAVRICYHPGAHSLKRCSYGPILFESSKSFSNALNGAFLTIFDSVVPETFFRVSSQITGGSPVFCVYEPVDLRPIHGLAAVGQANKLDTRPTINIGEVSLIVKEGIDR